MARVLLILDEASQLGNMKELRNAVTLLRGYEIGTWWHFQDTEQVKECFPEPSELFNNCDVQTYLAPNSLEAARTLSARLGEATVQVFSHQKGSGQSSPTRVPFEQPSAGSDSTNWSVTTSEVARHLMKPEEILQLSKDRFLGFVQGVPPICGELVPYYRSPEFRRGRCGRPAPLGLTAGLRTVMFLLAACAYCLLADALTAGRIGRACDAALQTLQSGPVRPDSDSVSPDP
jgi:type IV secretory pathway TraG/TraD family ATPase VirD4